MEKINTRMGGIDAANPRVEVEITEIEEGE
jgi:hypothetical protein